MITDNPEDDFRRWDSKREQERAKRPCCDRCGSTIWEDRAVHYDGNWICRDCEDDFFRDIAEDFYSDVEAD